MPRHQIPIDPEVLDQLKAKARPFEDHTPNDVLRRLLGLDPDTTALMRPGRKTPTDADPKRERLLPQIEYELPILRYLAAHGGRAPTSEVLEAVGDALGDRLTERDRQRLRTGRIRWQNRAQFVRLRLAERGELKRDSPRGVWELAERGYARVRVEGG